MTVKKSNILAFVLCIAVFLNNISQLPIFVELKITSPIAIAGWALAFIAILGDLKLRIQSIIVPVVTMFLCAIFWMITNNNYISEINRNFFLSVAIFIIGYSYSFYLDRDLFRKLCFLYILSSILVSVSVWYSYLLGTNSLSVAEYVYKPKNSLSQIILTAIVLLFVSFIIYKRFNNNRAKYVVAVVALVFELYVLFTLRSRATLIGFLLCVVIFLIGKGGKEETKKYRNIVIAILLIITVAIFVSESFYTLVFNNILFAGRNQYNLDALSSGRVTIISQFPDLINGHWLMGIGDYYLECFPLAEVLNNGIIVGLFQIIFAVSPLIWWFTNGRRTLYKEYSLIFVCIAVAYVVNGLFECLAPFGPGAKCSFLWLLFGILSHDSKWKLDDEADYS